MFRKGVGEGTIMGTLAVKTLNGSVDPLAGSLCGSFANLGMIGIDVSKDKLDAALTHQNTRRREWEDKAPNTIAGIQSLLDRTDPSLPWVVEPTGRYSSLVVQTATRAGRRVLLAPNRAAKLFLKSQSPRAKTDRLDSFGLALFGLSQDLRPFHLKSDTVEQLDQLLSARKGLSGSLTRLKLQRSELVYSRDALTPAIEALETQIKSIDTSIKKLTRSHDEFALVQSLETIPGVGPVTAAAIASRLLSKEFATKD